MSPKSAVSILVVLPLVVVGAAPAVAHEVPTGRHFGSHVSMHAQMHGFDGDRNPGVHQGFAGWREHHDMRLR